MRVHFHMEGSSFNHRQKIRYFLIIASQYAILVPNLSNSFNNQHKRSPCLFHFDPIATKTSKSSILFTKKQQQRSVIDAAEKKGGKKSNRVLQASFLDSTDQLSRIVFLLQNKLLCTFAKQCLLVWMNSSFWKCCKLQYYPFFKVVMIDRLYFFVASEIQTWCEATTFISILQTFLLCIVGKRY